MILPTKKWGREPSWRQVISLIRKNQGIKAIKKIKVQTNEKLSRLTSVAKVTIQDLPGYIGQNYLPRWFDMIFLVV